MDQNRKEYLMQASPFEALFARLAQSDFRSRFRLGSEEVACIERRGMAVIRRHAEDFVRRRMTAIPRRLFPTTAGRRPCGGTPFSSLSMPQPAAAAVVWLSGMRSLPVGS